MKKSLRFLLLFIVLTTSSNFLIAQVESKDDPKEERDEKQEKKKNEEKVFTDFITEEALADTGMFNVYFVSDKIYFEIPLDLLGKDMLLVSRIAQLPSNMSPYINAGSKVGEQVIRWEKRRDQILIKSVSYSDIADEDSPIHLSVRQNNLEPIMFAFKIECYSSDSSALLIQVNELFEKDVRFLSGLNATYRKNFKVSRLDQQRSFIDTIKSFPQNIEVKHTLTYDASAPPSNQRSSSLTLQMNQSMILLPEKLMKTRYFDERVGWFTIRQTDYSSEALKSDENTYIRRWRMEPMDKAAYLRGELVEPIKPIIYYLDPATPKKWRKYFIQGIEDWQSVFELAGFKNAIQAREAPSPDQDPDFSPEDVRYSTIRYVASTTRNAMGPSVSDPRTGEILESDVIWYHNHLRSYRNRYLIETGAANKNARTLNTPEEDIGEMMRMVIAHEVGHALGLPHNMKASSAYPTDSLRSVSFTQKMGIAASIMDYARYNYIAQPGDGNVRYVRKLGPYDEYAINWGYRWYGDDIDPEEEDKILRNLIEEKGNDPIYQFGNRGDDPRSLTECIGDDAIMASYYGIKNLRIVHENLEDWVCQKGEDYSDLKEIYGELLGVWSRYLGHVSAMIGVTYEDTKHYGQKGPVYRVVHKNRQRDAIHFLDKQLFSTPDWLIDPSLFQVISSSGNMERISNIQVSHLNRLLSSQRMEKMVEQLELFPQEAYAVDQFLNDLHRIIWRELKTENKLDFFKRQLQSAFINRLISIREEQDTRNPVMSDVKAIAGYELRILAKEIDKKLKGKSSPIEKAHWIHCSELIERALDAE